MLKDKVVILTGGTSGIGHVAALRMAEAGATVYACARRERKFDNPNIIYHRLDVTNTSSCEALFQNVVETHGKIDVLIADAGITADNLTVKMSEEAFDKVINTNLKGVFNIVKYVGPYMENRAGALLLLSVALLVNTAILARPIMLHLRRG